MKDLQNDAIVSKIYDNEQKSVTKLQLDLSHKKRRRFFRLFLYNRSRMLYNISTVADLSY